MTGSQASIVQLTDRRVDLVRQQVLHADGTTATLTTRESQLLRYLVDRSGDDVARDELLEEVWEYRANYATRAVDVAMRRLRSKVEPDPRHPVHLIAVHGVGYRFVPPAGEAPRFATPAPPPARTTNLRSDRSPFFGRAPELAQLGEMLSQGDRLVSLIGPGGVGKTRLALAAGRLAQQVSDGVFMVELTEASDVSGILAAVGAALAIPLTQDADDDELVRSVGRALASRGRLLLILDNFEQLVDHAAATVGQWLRLAPSTRFLVTTRQRLRLRGERMLPLQPLTGVEARELFLDRARAVGADLTAHDHGLVDQIIERLEGLPLAIELAATRARVLSLDQLMERLERRFKILASTSAANERQRTLQATIDWSWELLDPHERTALAQCSVFGGGFSLEAAEEVLEVDDDAPWTLDLVEALRDKSLLRVYEPDDLPGELRFGMLDSIREYAAQKLVEGGGLPRARERHANWMLEYTAGLASKVDGPGGLASFLQLAVETANLLSIERHRAQHDPRQALEAVLHLGPVLRVRGPTSLYRRLLDRALDRARELGDAPTLARLHLDRATLLRMAGELDDARRDVGEALTLARSSVAEIEVDALSRLAMINADQARIDESEVITQTALHLARELRLHRMVGTLLGQLTSCSIVRGDMERAEMHAVEAVNKQQETGDERGLANSFTNLSTVYAERGRLDDAAEYLERALRVHRAWGDRAGEATALSHLGSLHARQGDLQEAFDRILDAQARYHQVGYARYGALCQVNAAIVGWAMGDRAQAGDAFAEALEVFVRGGHRLLESMTLAYQAALQACEDHLDRAEATMARCDDRMSGMHNRQADGMRLVAQGFLEAARARREPQHPEAGAWRAAARQKASDGATSHVLAIQFMARLLEKELS